MKKYIIAIDGHSSCGKSTLAKDAAEELKYKYIDTGAMYRAVTLYAIENGMTANESVDIKGLRKDLGAGKIQVAFVTDDKSGKSLCTLNNRVVEEAIRQPDVNQYVSPVAALSFVRDAMRALQQDMGKEGAIIMEGRDIGTAVFPNADLKVFLTADPDVRTKRRYEEQKIKGMNISMKETKKNLLERDRIDSTRATDPLRKAEDARVLDNSHLNRREQCKLLTSWVKELDREEEED